MPSATKKFLDKQGIKWYNIRREGKDGKVDPLTIKFMEMFDQYQAGQLELSKSLDELQTTSTKNKIIELGKVVREVAESFMPGVRPPVIAGGAVRDMFFGMEPKDYDVFFDVSTVSDEDERDDFVLLFADAVKTKLMESTEPELKYTRLRSVGLGGAYNHGPSDVNTHKWGTGGKFYVYETLPDNVLWEEHLNEVFARAPEQVVNNPIRFQAIGHVDPNLTNDVPKFIEGFDYGLVKCWYDPNSEEFVFTEAFKEVLETKNILYSEVQSERRIADWAQRWYWQLEKWNPATGVREGTAFPFKLINTNPPQSKQNPYDRYFSKATKAPRWAELPPMAGQPWLNANVAGMPIRAVNNFADLNEEVFIVNDNF